MEMLSEFNSKNNPFGNNKTFWFYGLLRPRDRQVLGRTHKLLECCFFEKSIIFKISQSEANQASRNTKWCQETVDHLKFLYVNWQLLNDLELSKGGYARYIKWLLLKELSVTIHSLSLK